MTRKTKWWIAGSVAGVLFLAWLFCLPRDLFRGTAYSTVVTDRNGELLGARIADDGQWRFPPSDSIPERYAKALIQFEDRYFRYHPGVNPVAIVRALAGNIRAGHVTSGGSTITMQVIRLSRKKERTVIQKLVEAILATRLEVRCSKNEIISLYAAHAPFGGNVVGLEAASWRYFGRPAAELSWAEAATLAVLPNSPSSIHPGRNRDALLQKRNRLLRRLCEHGDISEETCLESMEEPLPGEPLPLPSLARQWVEHFPKGRRSVSSLVYEFQRNIESVVERESDHLSEEGIADMAVVVIDNRSGETVAYCGNSSPGRNRPGVQVDIAASPRSTGSILKPFLFCAAMEEGLILPETLLKDTPINLDGFAPQNFDRQFYGAVPASEALARSLNVPAVNLLRDYGVQKFHELLKSAGISTMTKESSYYGLSLILGGGEATLEELTRAYSRMARQLLYGNEDFPLRDRVAIGYTLDALRNVSRPDELDPNLIPSLRKAAWKTGTSYGFRDAWAIGMTPEWTIGVWTGNAQGQGVPGLTGARTSGPVLFTILNMLPMSEDWFPQADGGIFASTCPLSGHLAGPDCPHTEPVRLPERAADSEPCPYHAGGEFVLPPAMEWFYRGSHPEYRGAQRRASQTRTMEFIYPSQGTTLELPRQLDGSPGVAVFRIAHTKTDATVWWHLDNDYAGQTRFVHELRLRPSPGRHHVTVVDEDGNSLSISFTVR